jgi:hypothetical protein
MNRMSMDLLAIDSKSGHFRNEGSTVKKHLSG